MTGGCCQLSGDSVISHTCQYTASPRDWLWATVNDLTGLRQGLGPETLYSPPGSCSMNYKSLISCLLDPKLWGKIFSPGFDTFAILVPWYLRLWFSNGWDWCRLDLIFYSVSWIFDLFCLEGCAVQWSSCLIIRCTCTRSVLRLLSTILIIPVKWTMCTGKEMVGWSYLNFIIFTNKTCPSLNYYKICIHHCKPKNNCNQFCWQASLSLDLQ